MIQEFVDRWERGKPEIRKAFEEEHPDSYGSIVKAVVKVLHDAGQYESIDPERIHEIDDGDYQGTLLFVIAASGYQPNKYWCVKVCYGSCSGCDTLEAIRGYKNTPPTPDQVDDYMTLALHIVQGLKELP